MPQAKKHTDNAARQAAYRKRQKSAHQEQCRKRGLPALAPLPTMQSHARWNQILALVSALLGMAIAEMSDYQDARSEVWQESEKGRLSLSVWKPSPR
jgi:hypothetical protein